MSDLVERLRHADAHSQQRVLGSRIFAEAADEIERLRAVVQAGGRFRMGERIRKHSGAWWEGRVVGFYTTSQTPIGYCVQLDTVKNGPVQIYPEGALVAAPTTSGSGE